MSMTKRSPEFNETMCEQEAVRDPHEELAYQVWADDGGGTPVDIECFETQMEC